MLFLPASGLLDCRAAVGKIALAAAAGDEGLMAAGTFLPALARLIFLPKQLMPNSGVQLRLQRQDCPKEIITIHSAVMDGLVNLADHMAEPILWQAAAVGIKWGNGMCASPPLRFVIPGSPQHSYGGSRCNRRRGTPLLMEKSHTQWSLSIEPSAGVLAALGQVRNSRLAALPLAR